MASVRYPRSYTWDRTFRYHYLGENAYNVMYGYGAAGNGTTDDYASIRNAINAAAGTGGTVFLPTGTYRISQSLEMKSNVSIVGSGPGKTIIKPYHTGTHYPAFVCSSTEPTFCKISRLGVNFSNCGTPSTQSGDVAFSFVRSAAYGGAYELSDIQVTYANTAYKDTNGGWLSTLKRVWAHGCVNGFYKTGGTTTVFENCFAKGNQSSSVDGYGWYLDGTFNTVINGCAMDNYTANKPWYLLNNYGMVINGFTAETNYTPGSVANESIFYMANNDGLVINGFHPIWTKLNAVNSQGSYLMLISGGTTVANGLVLGGDKPSTYDDIVAGGNSGSTAVVLGLSGDAGTVLNGCQLTALKTSGYTGSRYTISHTSNLGGTVVNACRITGTIADSYSKVDQAKVF